LNYEWKHLDEERPVEGQAVYYWFGVFDSVFAGFFDGHDTFYGRAGWLNGDVSWWMPRDDHVDIPFGFLPGLTPEQKSQCKYHPISIGEHE